MASGANVSGSGATLAAPPALPAGTVDPNTMTMDTAVMSTAIDNQGCAVKPTTTFNLKDARIYIVAKVHKLVKGTEFTATWSGTVDHKDTWTADHTASVLCVHFYVDPVAIGMAAGPWTVSLSMGTLPAQTINFTVQDTSAPATASQ